MRETAEEANPTPVAESGDCGAADLYFQPAEREVCDDVVSGVVQAIEARGYYPSPFSGADWLQPTSTLSWQLSNTSWVNSNSS